MQDPEIGDIDEAVITLVKEILKLQDQVGQLEMEMEDLHNDMKALKEPSRIQLLN